MNEYFEEKKDQGSSGGDSGYKSYNTDKPKSTSERPNSSYNSGDSKYPQSDSKFPKKKLPPATVYLPYTVMVQDKNFPGELLDKVFSLTKFFKEKGFTARITGHDTENARPAIDGAGDMKELILPWQGFKSNFQKGDTVNKNEGFKFIEGEFYPSKRIKEFTPKFVAGYEELKPLPKAMASTNILAMLGPFLTSPSRCLITWTPDGCTSLDNRTRDTGFMFLPIKIAGIYNIPVFNLQNDDAEDKIQRFLSNFDSINPPPKENSY